MGTARDRRPAWYVIQVRATAEDAMCRQIERACAEHDEAVGDAGEVGLTECFCPKFRSRRKWKGEWQDVDRLLLPGYVIAEARDPERLAAAIGGIGGFCKLLSGGGAYVPLAEAECAWIDRQTRKGDRVIPMSFARKVGDEIVVDDGPLKGYPGRIVKVDRHNCLAHLEFHVGQMTIRTKVGLAVLPG